MHKLFEKIYFQFSLFAIFSSLAFRPRAPKHNYFYHQKNILAKYSQFSKNHKVRALVSMRTEAFDRLGAELSFCSINTAKTNVAVFACSDLHADSQRNQDWVRKKCVGIKVFLILRFFTHNWNN